MKSLVDGSWERVDRARADGATGLFKELIETAEAVLKLTCLGMLASLEDDRQRYHYREAHRLVRAGGLGEWTAVLDDILTGPAAQYLCDVARTEQGELTRLTGRGSWQYSCTEELHRVLKTLRLTREKLPQKVTALAWLQDVVTLRNKWAHGSIKSEHCPAVCADLESSIRHFVKNFSLFSRDWAHLHRNLSGKYRVQLLGGRPDSFEALQRTSDHNLPDGVYIHFGRYCRVELMYVNDDVTDFYLPNGKFGNKKFEAVSPFTGDRLSVDARDYLLPADQLPLSETAGLPRLDVVGQAFSNIPPAPKQYIHRRELEDSLFNVLVDDRHPVVTMVGRGGIGKTWTTLTVLHRLCHSERFFALLWFSSRDIDLLAEGPKIVRRDVLRQKDIAAQYAELVGTEEGKLKETQRQELLREGLSSQPFDKPILFVFDNFETVQNPSELYLWLDQFIRLPNKVLITTRFRDFKGDYPIDVRGMNEDEFVELTSMTARSLGISDAQMKRLRSQLYEVSGGHPYVAKVLMNEISRTGKISAPAKALAEKDAILNALFERTYSNLSPGAKRVFLTLCQWRSTVVVAALEAVLMSSTKGTLDVPASLEELERCSFVELDEDKEQNLFVTVPLVAAVFGTRKLQVDPMKYEIDLDVEYLQLFGAATPIDVRHGIEPRVRRLFTSVAGRLYRSSESIEKYLPMLEYISRKYSRGWLMLSDLYEELGGRENLKAAKGALRNFLEFSPPPGEALRAWKRMAGLSRRDGDYASELHALVEVCENTTADLSDVSWAARAVNTVMAQDSGTFDYELRQRLLQRVIAAMEDRKTEATADDFSRLAWLYVYLDDRSSAKRYAEQGLVEDPTNEHCLKLVSRLSA